MKQARFEQISKTNPLSQYRPRPVLNFMLSPLERNILLSKVELWIGKAGVETDQFDKFVSFFTAFNILYNMNAKEQDSEADLSDGDKKRSIEVRTLVRDPNGLFISLKNPLSKYLQVLPSFREEYWDKIGTFGISGHLKESFAKGESNNVIQYLLMWLYKVRCNLIRGSKDYNESNQEELLRHSSELLGIILGSLVTDYKARYHN
jgi:hypothetical protein